MTITDLEYPVTQQEYFATARWQTFNCWWEGEWMRALLALSLLVSEGEGQRRWVLSGVHVYHRARKMKGASLADAGPSRSDVSAWQWSHSKPLAAILLLIIKLYKSKKLTLAVQNAPQAVLAWGSPSLQWLMTPRPLIWVTALSPSCLAVCVFSLI